MGGGFRVKGSGARLICETVRLNHKRNMEVGGHKHALPT